MCLSGLLLPHRQRKLNRTTTTESASTGIGKVQRTVKSISDNDQHDVDDLGNDCCKYPTNDKSPVIIGTCVGSSNSLRRARDSSMATAAPLVASTVKCPITIYIYLHLDP